MSVRTKRRQDVHYTDQHNQIAIKKHTSSYYIELKMKRREDVKEFNNKKCEQTRERLESSSGRLSAIWAYKHTSIDS